ncbi:uncharacterized protein G2W53_036330 [Senna tora]|uniref:Uncharacterized protein n=1 Tax=Senna tora TaxID=362788 RepID=A0A834W4Z6_9FABA|nr:uncharacterized protein G2W53_036330 [Senna tora]
MVPRPLYGRAKEASVAGGKRNGSSASSAEKQKDEFSNSAVQYKGDKSNIKTLIRVRT